MIVVAMYRSVHMFIGGCFGLLLGEDLYSSLISSLMGAIGGYVPDIDYDCRKIKHRKTLHNVFSLVALTMIVYGALLYIARYTFLDPIDAYRFSLAFGSGMALHILFDSTTKKGVWILYPFSNKRLRIPIFKSSSVWANGFGISMGLFFLYLWIRRFDIDYLVKKAISYLLSIS